MTDWSLPEHRREIFQRSYTFSLETGTFPGMVYPMLPAIANAFDLDGDGRAWLAWLNGNTQNVVTSYLLLEVAPTARDWQKAADFFNENFKALEWDTDRRHQKSAFPRATEQWMNGPWGRELSAGWLDAAMEGREEPWKWAISQPYMGRISAWSMLEFARILLPFIPDVNEWFLKESSSRSHRNALCLLAGHEGAWGWDREQVEIPFLLDLFEELDALAEDLLLEAQQRNTRQLWDGSWEEDPNVSRLTLESALCTFKSWHKPDRRYPGVYADMMYQRIRKAETRMGRTLDLLWNIRRDTLPGYLRLEDNPNDPGLVGVKQNWFRETGEVHYLHHIFPDMEPSGFETAVAAGEYGERKDPKW